MNPNFTQAAKEFFETDEGKATILPATEGVEYLDIDVIDFSDQNVDNLFSGKYVAAYIIKDLKPYSDEVLKDSYYKKGIMSSLFYPTHIQDKLKQVHGVKKLYASKVNGTTASSFDYDLLSESDKDTYVEYEESTNYFANSIEACDNMWEPLTKDDIAEVITHAKGIVDESIPMLYKTETSAERPYAVNVFNDSVASFICTYATYEECKQVLSRIHTDKIKILTDEMVFI